MNNRYQVRNLIAVCLLVVLSVLSVLTRSGLATLSPNGVAQPLLPQSASDNSLAAVRQSRSRHPHRRRQTLSALAVRTSPPSQCLPHQSRIRRGARTLGSPAYLLPSRSKYSGSLVRHRPVLLPGAPLPRGTSLLRSRSKGVPPNQRWPRRIELQRCSSLAYGPA